MNFNNQFLSNFKNITNLNISSQKDNKAITITYMTYFKSSRFDLKLKHIVKDGLNRLHIASDFDGTLLQNLI